MSWFVKIVLLFFDNPLALLKFRTEPYAALPLEYNLFRLTFSDFERDPSSSIFRFGILVDNKFRWNLSCFQNGKRNIWKVGTFRLSAHTKSTIDYFVSRLSNMIFSN